MNPIVIIIGVGLFVSGIVLGRQSQSPASKMFGFTQEVTPTVSPTPTEAPKPTEESTPSPIPTLKPSVTLKPTSPPQSSSTNLSDFKYPGSSVSIDSSSKLVLSNNDSPATITTWYENKINELGYSARSSAKTNTNGNVLNKLGGGKNNSSVTIEISKKSGDASATITVTAGTDNGSDVHIKIENNEAYL